MSIKIMSEVWEHAPFVGTDLLILLSLADMANDDRECWPGLKHVAHKGRITVQQATAVLKNLSLQGIIEIKHRKLPERGNISNMYYIKPVAEWDLLVEYERSNPYPSTAYPPTNVQHTPLPKQSIPPSNNARGENGIKSSLETPLETKVESIHAPKGADHIAPLIKAWLDASQIIAPNSYANKTIRTKAQVMIDLGIQPIHITECIQSMRKDKFWQDKGISFETVAKTIQPWLNKNKPSWNKIQTASPVDEFGLTDFGQK